MASTSWYIASTTIFMGSSNSYGGREIHFQYGEDMVFKPAVYKVRCIYCTQKQDSTNDHCKYCGAPLP